MGDDAGAGDLFDGVCEGVPEVQGLAWASLARVGGDHACFCRDAAADDVSQDLAIPMIAYWGFVLLGFALSALAAFSLFLERLTAGGTRG